MLTGKYFGWCHHTRLKAVVHRQQHRHQSHHRLAATHIALQKTVHLVARDGILTNLLYNSFLCPRKRERYLLAEECVKPLANFWEEKTVVLRQTVAAHRLNGELNTQKLVKLESSLCRLQLFSRLGEVDVVNSLL